MSSRRFQQAALLQEIQFLENRRHTEYHEPTDDEIDEALKWQFDFRNALLVGDALELARKMPSNSVDIIITSPPYFAVRDYGIARQLGLEDVFDCMILFWNGQIEKNAFPCGTCYLCKMVEIFKELKRILKPTGIMYLNIGDTFFGTGFGRDKNIQKTKTASNAGVMHNREQMRTLRARQSKLKYYKDSCLCLIPERLATALVDRVGFWLKGKPIWDKLNGMPSSAKNRYTLNYENVYVFTKIKTGYYFNRELVREKLKESTIKRDKYPVGVFKHDSKTGAHHSRHSERYKKMEFVDDPEDYDDAPVETNIRFGGWKHAGHNGNKAYSGKKYVKRDKYKNPGSVWSMSTKSFGKEYCVPCDRLRPKAEMIEICAQCKHEFGISATRKGEEWDICPVCNAETDHDLLCFECKAQVHQHYAMFNEDFVLRMMKAGAPRSCCAECGMPKFPIVKPTAEYAKYLGKGYHKHKKDSRAGMMQRKQVKSVSSDYRIVGYEARCKCNAGFIPGLVLDPFAGFCTVAAVAQRWGVDYAGFDIDPKNIAAGKRRLADDREEMKKTPVEIAKSLEIDIANGQ